MDRLTYAVDFYKIDGVVCHECHVFFECKDIEVNIKTFYFYCVECRKKIFDELYEQKKVEAPGYPIRSVKFWTIPLIADISLDSIIEENRMNFKYAKRSTIEYHDMLDESRAYLWYGEFIDEFVKNDHKPSEFVCHLATYRDDVNTLERLMLYDMNKCVGCSNSFSYHMKMAYDHNAFNTLYFYRSKGLDEADMYIKKYIIKKWRKVMIVLRVMSCYHRFLERYYAFGSQQYLEKKKHFDELKSKRKN